MNWVVKLYVDVHETSDGTIGRLADTFGPMPEDEAHQVATTLTIEHLGKAVAFVVERAHRRAS